LTLLRLEASASVLRLLVSVFRDLFQTRGSLEAEVIVLRHQVAVL
jgi:hypothetical protein